MQQHMLQQFLAVYLLILSSVPPTTKDLHKII